MPEIDRWADAKCRQQEPDAMFVRGSEQNKAKETCKSCLVRAACLAEALDNQIEWGVWGGMTERERRSLLRRRPMHSWSQVVAAAEAHAEEQRLPLDLNGYLSLEEAG